MIEFISVIFSLLCVWLTTRKNILCWPVGIIGIIGYSIIFYDKGDWCNFVLQFAFIVQSVFGWINWKKFEDFKVSRLELADRSYYMILMCHILPFLYFLSKSFGGSLSFLDSITTTLSICGMYLLTKKKIEAWWCWIVADFIYIYFFYINQLYISSFLYFIFLILAIYGLRNWSKELINN